MNFQEAVKTCLTKYVDFSGRASRPEYWWYALFIFATSIVLSLFSDLLGLVFAVATLLPSLAAAVRRLHDTERSGWWVLISLVPFVGWIVLIVLLAQPTKTLGFETPGAV